LSAKQYATVELPSAGAYRLAASGSGVNPNIFFGGGDRGAEGAEEGGVHWGGAWGGGTAPPQKFFWILDLKMAICGAFFGAIFLQFS